MAADVFETMAALGVPSSDMTDVSEVQPFRVSTVGERLMLRRGAEAMFNLSPDQFVDNPWGFPIIPLPVKRDHDPSRLMIAPATISFEGVGHPIFWIEPELTRRTAEERQHPERWAVRMFYLIMALGMFDPDTLRWFNVPRSQGVEYDSSDHVAYTQGGSSALDQVRPLGLGDLLEPMESVTETTARALQQCSKVQEAAWTSYRTELSAAYQTAVASTSGRSPWDGLDARMRETIAKIAASVEKGSATSTLVPEVYAQISELGELVAINERCAIVLSLPVLREPTQAQRVAMAATATRAASAEVDVNIASLQASAHRLFELTQSSSAVDFASLHSQATEAYMKSWRVMMIAARNLVRVAANQNSYSSWDELTLVESMDRVQWPPLSGLLAQLER